ncbi:MAG: hypothetical protein ABI758_00520 [Candidatus Woesebacteria bacterium]
MTVQSNVNTVTVQKDKEYLVIIKKYASKDRFQCEAYYLNACSSQGIRTPSILEVNGEQNSIRMKGISGLVKRYLSNGELNVCINQLISFQKLFPLDSTKGNTRGDYINKVRENVLFFSRKTGADVCMPQYEKNLRALESLFFPALFKDAKPENWVFHEDNVSMIDFDYVVPSFILADFAQLIKFQYTDPNIEIYPLLKKFLSGVRNATLLGQLSEYEAVLPIVVANSCISAIRLNPNTSETDANYLLRLTSKLLQESKII